MGVERDGMSICWGRPVGTDTDLEKDRPRCKSRYPEWKAKTNGRSHSRKLAQSEYNLGRQKGFRGQILMETQGDNIR